MKKTGTFVIGIFIIAVFLLLAIFADFFAPYAPSAINLGEELQPPSKEFLLGTDHQGGDILSQIIYGSRIALIVGFSVVFISSAIGTIIGLISGYLGGVWDRIIMAITDIFMAFPTILLAIFILFIMEDPGIGSLVFALCITGWVAYARVVRGQVLTVKEREYVVAGQALGFPKGRIIFMHILPNIISPLLVQASFGVAGAIISESSLSFLGLGPNNVYSWGRMLSIGMQKMLQANGLLMPVFPGIALMLVVMAFNFVGDGLRDAWARKQGEQSLMDG